MARVISSVGPFAMRKRAAGTDFESLVRAIVSQQVSGAAATTILGRFRGLYPEVPFPTPAQVLGTPVETLRSVGLSRQKQAAIADLCQHVLRGDLPLGELADLDDETLIGRVSAVRGIGRWSAQMFLIFHLGRLDVWPEGDLGIRKGVARLRKREDLPSRAEMLEEGARWSPFCTVAAWYLWRSLAGEAQI